MSKMPKSLFHKRTLAILFSLSTACVLAFAGLLLSSYLWGRFGPPPADIDDTKGYLFSLLISVLLASSAIIASLWMFWPRATKT
jgi:hypothetical protein